MIRHVCMFKLSEDHKAENLNKILTLGEELKTLPQTTGGMIVVNSPLAPLNNYDFCLIFDFKSIEDLNSYQVDPVHKNFAGFIKTCMESRACIDYEL